MPVEQQDLRRLRGWLLLFVVLIGIGVVGGLVQIPAAFAALGDSSELTRGVPRLAALARVEAVVHLIQILAASIGLGLILARRPIAPLFWQLYLAVLVVYGVVDILMIRSLDLTTLPDDARTTLGAALVASQIQMTVQVLMMTLWLFYWRRSKRVRAFFADPPPEPATADPSLSLNGAMPPLMKRPPSGFARVRPMLAPMALGVLALAIGSYYAYHRLSGMLLSRAVNKVCSDDRETYFCLAREGQDSVFVEGVDGLVRSTSLTLDERSGIEVNLWGAEYRGFQLLSARSGNLRQGIGVAIASWDTAEKGEGVLSLSGGEEPCVPVAGKVWPARLRREQGVLSQLELVFKVSCRDDSRSIRGKVCVRCGEGEQPESVAESRELEKNPPLGDAEDLKSNRNLTIIPDLLNRECPQGPESFLCLIAARGQPFSTTSSLYLTPAEGDFEFDYFASTIQLLHKGLADIRIAFKAPQHSYLWPGLYRGGDIHPQIAGMKVWVAGSQIKTEKAQFVLEEIRFDERGHVSNLASSFEIVTDQQAVIRGRLCYHCSSDAWQPGQRQAVPQLREGDSFQAPSSLPGSGSMCESDLPNYLCVMQPTGQEVPLGGRAVIFSPRDGDLVIDYQRRDPSTGRDRGQLKVYYKEGRRSHSFGITAPQGEDLTLGRFFNPTTGFHNDCRHRSRHEFTISSFKLDAAGQLTALDLKFRSSCQPAVGFSGVLRVREPS